VCLLVSAINKASITAKTITIRVDAMDGPLLVDLVEIFLLLQLGNSRWRILDIVQQVS
jgi:hypothetical protein